MEVNMYRKRIQFLVSRNIDNTTGNNDFEQRKIIPPTLESLKFTILKGDNYNLTQYI